MNKWIPRACNTFEFYLFCKASNDRNIEILDGKSFAEAIHRKKNNGQDICVVEGEQKQSVDIFVCNQIKICIGSLLLLRSTK